ncbi:response regulator transcription factor [Faecalibaculum rodentium]|uniref:response regulator transcription factor n=1 Tax=Faecalibaculum rodentium TaxID=1702221 RepID=UPI0023F1C734|nr:response regulator transcription factor [Faecalibaculum rodentium]
MKILIVEDDPGYAKGLQMAFQDWPVRWCRSLDSALKALAAREPFSLVLLDLGLPDGDGAELLKWIRTYSDIPVLILTGRDEEEVILESYRHQADDFLVKPVRLPVLKAKVSRILERNSILRIPGCRLNLELGILETEGQSFSLTETQAAILQPLFEMSGKTVSADRIRRSILSRTSFDMSANTISARISDLRKMLREAGLTLSGTRQTGYRIVSQ